MVFWTAATAAAMRSWVRRYLAVWSQGVVWPLTTYSTPLPQAEDLLAASTEQAVVSPLTA